MRLVQQELLEFSKSERAGRDGEFAARLNRLKANLPPGSLRWLLAQVLLGRNFE